MAQPFLLTAQAAPVVGTAEKATNSLLDNGVLGAVCVLLIIAVCVLVWYIVAERRRTDAQREAQQAKHEAALAAQTKLVEDARDAQLAAAGRYQESLLRLNETSQKTSSDVYTALQARGIFEEQMRDSVKDVLDELRAGRKGRT